jgi:hypothetical protein
MRNPSQLRLSFSRADIRRLLVLRSAIAALAFAMIALPTSTARGQCMGERNLRVMTWNIHMRPDKELLPVAGLLIPIGAPSEDEIYGLPDWQRANWKIFHRIKRKRSVDRVVIPGRAHGTMGVDTRRGHVDDQRDGA